MQPQRVKYPRTPHLPWSRPNKDDVQLFDLRHFKDREVVVTEKMDGENTTMGTDYIHARSVDSRHHPSRAWVKALHARIGKDIPAGWRLCGENLYAQHSLTYDQLESFFYLFSVWDDTQTCLSWDQTREWASTLELPTPPLLYRGPWSEALLRQLDIDTSCCEGYVVRTTEGFKHTDFNKYVAKWVRTGHVQTNEHWMHSELKANTLKSP